MSKLSDVAGGSANNSLSNLDAVGKDKTCTAWVSFNTATGAIIASHNIDSVSAISTGKRGINISAGVMNNTTYAPVVTCSGASPNMIVPTISSLVTKTVTYFELHIGYANSTLWSSNGETYVAIFGGA